MCDRLQAEHATHIKLHGHGADFLCSRSSNSFSGKPHRGPDHPGWLLPILNSVVITFGCMVMVTALCSHNLVYFRACRVSRWCLQHSEASIQCRGVSQSLAPMIEPPGLRWKCVPEVQAKRAEAWPSNNRTQDRANLPRGTFE